MNTLNTLSDAAETLRQVNAALVAFNAMLGRSLAGQVEPQFNIGVKNLLDNQIDTLVRVEDSLFECLETIDETEPGMTPEERIAEMLRQAALADAGRPAWHDLDTIAARSRVRRDDVARVMFTLTGEDHAGPAYRAWDGNLAEGMHAHLLAGKCLDALAYCDMWRQVSEATGLSLEKTKDVLHSMLEYLPKREVIDMRPFGAVLDAQVAERAMRERVAEQDAQGSSDTALTEAVDRLRRADLGEIAREVNLDESAVRRVVERLLAEPHPDPETAVNG